MANNPLPAAARLQSPFFSASPAFLSLVLFDVSKLPGAGLQDASQEIIQQTKPHNEEAKAAALNAAAFIVKPNRTLRCMR